jgi:hypothetical protein
MEKKINYYSRDFRSIRNELVTFVKNNYPDYYVDFNDASIGMMLIELNAAVGDMLSFNTDRAYQENNIDYAQERRSLYAIARTFGLKITSKSPSITICDISVDLPVSGNSFDLQYCPIIVRGAQITGANLIFETLNDVDFASPFSQTGVPNRTVVPNIDSTGNIVSYTITKREIVSNGVTKFYKKVITSSDTVPFLEIALPDNDVISIDRVISLDGTDYSRLPTLVEWETESNKWYQVDSLAEKQVFIEKPQALSDNSAIKVGEWKTVYNKYMIEYTDKGYCFVRFGNGSQDTSFFSDYVANNDLLFKQLDGEINNNSLGSIPRTNTTLFIQYRTGGGLRTNIGANVLNTVNNINIIVNGTNQTKNALVKASVKVNNPLPALGGKDQLTIEELRNLIKFNFSAQNRCITLEDYYNRINLMSGNFGAPYRTSVAKLDNKIEVVICGIDENSKLTNESTTTLKENIASYLSKYRSINDYILVRDGKIINIGFDITLYVTKTSDKVEILRNAVQQITSYFSTQNYFGNNIYLSDLIESLNNIGNVLNVTSIRIFNKVGGNYSLNQTSMPFVDATTKEIDLSLHQTLFVEYDEIYEIKFPETDIKINFAF